MLTHDEVWERVKSFAEQAAQTGKRIITLEKGTVNIITDVRDGTIGRRSADGTTQASRVGRKMVFKVWDELLAKGHTGCPPSVLYFTLPLMLAALDDLLIRVGDREIGLRQLTEPTADPDELQQRVHRLQQIPSLPRPARRQGPSKRTTAPRTAYERRPNVKAWVLIQSEGRCGLCQLPAPFAGDDGEPYLEVHHVQRLAEGGSDEVENAAAVCPNCHRRLHHGADRAAQRERLYRQIPWLIGGGARTHRLFVAYPTLRAAAGAPPPPINLPPEANTVRLPVTPHKDGLFGVRASGDSMNGGKSPIHDGDWLVMEDARGASYDEVVGEIALLQIPDMESGFSYQVKRVVREGGRWLLRSENHDYSSPDGTADTIPIAKLVEVIQPENIGPPAGQKLADEELSAAFHLEASPKTGRHDGHLFLCIEGPGSLVRQDRIRTVLPDQRPGETAFVLTRPPGDSMWQYVGVARYIEEEGLWACPPIDDATYRALGGG